MALAVNTTPASAIQIIGDGNPSGTSLGLSATELIGMHGVVAVQAAAITAPVATGSATSSYGFTQTQADALVTAVRAIIVALQAKGITA